MLRKLVGQSQKILALSTDKMAQKLLLIFFIIASVVDSYHGGVIDRNLQSARVFNYQGSMPPIKDDRTGEVILTNSDEVKLNSNNQTDDGEICWNLIVEQSVVTFALQTRVLDQLEVEMKDLSMDSSLRAVIDKMIGSMRKNMKDALEALKQDSPEDYFDSLFDTSENIIAMSTIMRDPKIDERVYLVLIKAVSRLGRNNSALVQEFIDQCSIAERSRPRTLTSFSTPS